jgi:hypothetical protein
MANGDLILTHGIQKMDMALVPMQTQRMGASGASLRVTLGPSLWRLDVQTGYLPEAQAREWDAWLARRIHFGETFTAWRYLRENPAGNIGTPDSGVTLAAVDIPNNELDLTGATNYTARAGDMISYRTDTNGYYLGMITAPVSASGGSVSVPVVPTPLAKHATTPALRRVQALGEFELATAIEPFGDYTADPGGRRLNFQAMQVLR